MMNQGAKWTAYIAVALILTAIFPLLGAITGFILLGMALHSLLSTPQQQKNAEREIQAIMEERNNEALRVSTEKRRLLRSR